VDELEDVRQQFIADVGAYVEDVQLAAEEARGFAESARAAKDEADGLRDGLSEAAVAAGIYRDEMGRLRDAQGRFASAASVAATEMGHVRDEAAAAAVSVKELGKQADETAAKLDLMGLSGASTFTSLGGLIGLIGGLVVVGAGVAPAFLAAGAGIGAFGALALPTLQNVFSAVQQVSKAQSVLNSATSTAKQRATALQQEKAIWASLPAPIAMVVTEVMNLKAQWQDLGKQFQMPVVQDLSQVIGIVSDLLPKIVPLATAGAGAVHMLLSALGTSVGSSGFTQFLQLLTNFVGPATQAIMHLAGALTHILGSAIETLMGNAPPLINFLADLVTALGGPLVTAIHFVVDLLVNLLGAIDPLLPGLSQIATLLVTDIGTSFEALIPVLSQVIQLIGGSLITILQELEPVIANALTPNGPFMAALAMLPRLLQAILPLFTGLASVLKNPMWASLAVDVLSGIVALKAVIGIISLVRGAFIALTAVMEINPFILIATVIAALVVAFIELWNHSAAFRNFWIGLWHDILAAAAPAIAFVKQEIGILTTWWNAHWTEIREVARIAWALISGYVTTYVKVVMIEIKLALELISIIWRIAWGEIRDLFLLVWNVMRAAVTAFTRVILDIVAIFLDVITGHWSKAWHDIQKLFHDYVNGIVSIARAFGSGLVRFFVDLGHNIIQGLISGIKDMAGAVFGVLGTIAHGISSTFSSVLHILSPSRVFYEHGRNTLLGYIQGIAAVAPQVQAALAAVGGHVAMGGLPGIAVAGAAGAAGFASGHLNVTVTVAPGAGNMADARWLQWLQQAFQEAALRYNLNNPNNGLAFGAGRV